MSKKATMAMTVKKATMIENILIARLENIKTGLR